MTIHYRKGYDKVLDAQAFFSTDVIPPAKITTDFIELDENGFLTIRKNYAWNGGTMAIDDKAMTYASLAHDALYQLIAEGLLPESYRLAADKVLDELLAEAYEKQKGFAAAARRMSGLAAARRWWVQRAVNKFGGNFANKKPETFTAP